MSKMFLILLSIFLVSLALLACQHGKRRRDYWRRRGVPHLPPHPILGSLTFLQRENPSVWMRRMYDKFRSPYVGIWLFWRPALIINCPDIARNVLVKDASVFKDRFLSSGKSDPIGALNLFTVKDPLWSSLRRRLTVVFTSHRLRALHALTADSCNHLVHRIYNEIQQNKYTDLRVLFADFTTDITGCASFGLSGSATLTGHSAMRRVTQHFMGYSALRGLCWSSIFFCPQLVDIFGFSLFPESATKYFREIFRTVVEKRGGYDRKIDEPRDLLDALLKIRQESLNDKEEISEDVLIAQAAIFVEGGFDTSAAAMTYTIYELAFHPEIQNKMYEEILEAKNQYGVEGLDANVLSDLKYFNCVIKEVTRKYSSMGWLDRIASQDYKIDENLTIAAGTPVYVNAIGMHYDPDYFPNPSKFNPDRFLPENEKNIKPFTFMPFGEGPRSCIGKRFGLQTMRYGLAHVLLHYEVRPVPGAPTPSRAKIDKRGMFLMPGEPLYVHYIPRCDK
ncbi:PREDICTED: cytochrome P450 6k1-like isoform X1 [Papilio polytes]|uniref:cytochrome P450 6k1-like isoform X1 n=2 Tax=Papilio polytes TaxID=76194 RepID=UPI000675D3A1|nr:PREDICTED: cytochrome P450 6k1-like isoform X1 [Papilio polytes]